VGGWHFLRKWNRCAKLSPGILRICSLDPKGSGRNACCLLLSLACERLSAAILRSQSSPGSPLSSREKIEGPLGRSTALAHWAVPVFHPGTTGCKRDRATRLCYRLGVSAAAWPGVALHQCFAKANVGYDCRQSSLSTTSHDRPILRGPDICLYQTPPTKKAAAETLLAGN
jgi:hypothetical protein